MTEQTRVVVLQPIPPRAEAMEQRLREIREQATLEERLDAWRALAKESVA